MGRILNRRSGRQVRATAARRRRFALGTAAALAAMLAQLFVAIIHEFPHEHAAAAMVANGQHGHEHDEGPSPSPPGDDDSPLCAIGQALLQLAAVPPAMAGAVLLPDWHRQPTARPRPAAAAVPRLTQAARPRAPPVFA